MPRSSTSGVASPQIVSVTAHSRHSITHMLSVRDASSLVILHTYGTSSEGVLESYRCHCCLCESVNRSTPYFEPPLTPTGLVSTASLVKLQGSQHHRFQACSELVMDLLVSGTILPRNVPARSAIRDKSALSHREVRWNERETYEELHLGNLLVDLLHELNDKVYQLVLQHLRRVSVGDQERDVITLQTQQVSIRVPLPHRHLAFQ